MRSAAFAMLAVAALVLGGTALWCAASDEPVLAPGLDAVTTATRPSVHKSTTPKKTPEATQAEKAADEANIAEAVFRYQISHKTTTEQAAAYFLALGSASSPKNPGADFLKRFESNTPPVKGVTESTKSGASLAVTDKASGKPGVLFRVERLTWVSKDEADVTGGVYESAKTSTSETYKVTRQGSAWSVSANAKG